MLTQPVHGWTDFHLEGAGVYGLSYLDDIALEWTERAVHGLETLSPFCVKGFLEPGRLLCAVSYWNCHIIVEDDERQPLKQDRVIHECSHTSMLQFCQYLYEDISAGVDDWAVFADYYGLDMEAKKPLLLQRLERLRVLIEEKAEYFDERHCFL